MTSYQARLMTGYWIRRPGALYWEEVSSAQYVRVEREQGLHNNTLGQSDQPATAAFAGADGTEGTTVEPDQVAVPGFDPYHFTYSPLGEPIELADWVALRKEPQITDTTLGTLLLRTVYLGWVDPGIPAARLFGTALIDGETVLQLDVHNSEAAAILRHQEHASAIQAGHHCALCRDGLDHVID